MRIPLPERLDRLARWLDPCRTFGSYYPLHRYPTGSRHIPDGQVSPEDILVEEFLGDTECLFAVHEQAGGDFVFSAAPFLGLPWLEASLGCGVAADHASGSTRSIPPPGFAERPVIPQFSPDNPWVAKMLEFIPALERRSAGRYPVGVTLMRGISDLLSALYGPENFVLRMHDDPEEIRRVVDALTEYWIAFGRCFLERLPLFHGGTGAFLFSLWCPGKTIWLQEDAVALLSPALYQEFILPADCRIARTFEHTMMHLHPTRFIPSAQLAATNLAAIELHIDHDGPRAESLERHYRTVLASKPLLIWGDLTTADLDLIFSRLPHAGLAVNVVVNTPPEAQAVWERMAAAHRL